MKFYAFENLEVYQLARKLTVQIYDITRSNFPSEEKFGLTSQIRRAASSVCLNIAEGNSRWSYKEKIRFLETSFSSLMEVISCLHLAQDLNFISEDMVTEKRKLINQVSYKLNGLSNYYQKKLKEN